MYQADNNSGKLVMINRLRKHMKDYILSLVKKQTPSPKVTKTEIEIEALCQSGVIGLGAIWDVYDMWI